MNRIFLRALSVGLFILLCATTLMAQVTVTPTIIMMSTRARSAQITLTNTTASPVEVTLGFGYSVMRTDVFARGYKDTNVTDEERQWSSAGWLKAFPRKLTIPANGSRGVRIMANIPTGHKDGEYWADFLMTTKTVERPHEMRDTLDSAGVATVDLGFRLVIALPVNVRLGEVATGVEFNKAMMYRDTVGEWLLLDVKQLNNAAYRGHVTATLRAADGSSVVSIEKDFTALFVRRLAFLLGHVPAGTYTLELHAEAGRKGAAGEFALEAEPVIATYDITVGSEKSTIQPR